MIRYFIKYKYGAQPKNNAEKQANALCQEYDCVLLKDEESKAKIMDNIKCGIEAINQKHTRCKDIRFHCWDSDLTQHIGIGENLCYLRIYPIKNEI